MLAKKNRLYKDKEIKELLKKGQTIFLPEFIIKHKSNKEEVKVGFIISTKVDKKAVQRNLLKRRLREVMRGLLPRIKSKHSLLIIAKKPAVKLKITEIKSRLMVAFSKKNIYNEQDSDNI